jgi:glucosamine--fructose-6-phosphate aminotransferase (isomerizing)
MCGIIGYIGPKQVTPLLLEALRRLEYRGYDSAGVAVLSEPVADAAPRELQVVRCRGKLSELEGQLAEGAPVGHVGIGHTRWATHGRPSDENAHPHRFRSVAVVHNGIIENYLLLKRSLSDRGHTFSSETDTEIIAHLIWEELAQVEPGPDRLLLATRRALQLVEGAYAVVVLCTDTPDEIVCAKSASPLVVGLGDGENLIASDVPALLPHTRRVIFLEEGDLAQLTRSRVRVVGLDGAERQRPVRQITWSLLAAEKDGYKHFMLKEIHEQPRAVTDTLRGRLIHSPPSALLDGFEIDPTQVRRLFILACGTSYHASLVGKYLIESLARIPVEVDLASEFRYRDPIVKPGDLVVAVSQSGETADTLAAIREAQKKGAQVFSIANVLDSSIPRASSHALYTHAGPEIGVASTKAFTTQLIALALLALHLGRRSGNLSEAAAADFVHELTALPAKLAQVLHTAEQLQQLARTYGHARDMLYLGRGPQFPIALEGALKLKEISYIHAEGFAAGEMKHGPIALIDEGMPVLVLAPHDGGYEKVLSNLSEVKARGGRVIAITTEGDRSLTALADHVVEVPAVHPLLAPVITVVPLQLFAYYVADFKGTDVDQPRNLAKSVTVE